MGDYGLNQTFEYSELCVDSWDGSSSGGQFFEGSNSNTSLIKYSWPRYAYTSKRPNVAAMKVLQAEIPFVWDVITTSNNTFVYTSGVTSYTITIPVGTYTGPQLAAQLQILLGGITAGFTVTWSSQLIKFTFTSPLASAWGLSFIDRQTAYSVLGFIPGQEYTNVGINSKIVSPIIAQVTGPYYLYVNSNKIGSLLNFNLPDGAVTGGIGPEICRIPVNVQFGSVVFYTDPGIFYFNRSIEIFRFFQRDPV